MEIGSRIKFQRLNKGITQEKLAEGIISKSYLSKIENNQAIAAEEIIQILCEKLEISYDENQRENNQKTIEKWFELLLKGEKAEAIRLYDWINGNLNESMDIDLMKLYEIHKIRYFVITHQYKKAENQILNLTPILSNYSSSEKYYWYKFIGDYYYGLSIYESALENYKSAEKYLDFNLFFYHEDKSDLYYLQSLAAVQLWKFHLSIYYAEKALSYYQSVYKLLRCAQCHLTIGIAYKRLGEIDIAIESYNKAYDIGKALNSKNLTANCHQNLGSLYFDKKDIQTAVYHYNKSLEEKENESPSKKLVTIVSLIKLYFQEKEIEKTKTWISHGFEIVNNNQKLKLSIINLLDLKLYNYLINGPDESLETFILDEAIPLLTEKKLNKEKQIYYKYLADYYFEDRKYKNACIYYQKSQT